MAVPSSKSERFDVQRQSVGRCARCGYKHGARRCPALGKTCYSCKGIGRFTSMCRTKKGATVQTVSQDTEEGGEDVVYTVGPQSPSNEEAARDDAPRFEVDTLGTKGPTWQCDLMTDGQRVDTGAQVNLLPHEVYRKLSPRPQLHPTRSRLFAYGADSPIPIKGQCICSVRLPQGETRKLRFHALSQEVAAVPLLGLQACEQLGLIKRVLAATHDMTTEKESDDSLEEVRGDSVASDFMDLFAGFGLMKDYTYQIALKNAKHPYVLATARRVPYHLYEQVQRELQRMLRLGVIEEVNEPTSWCSPMVVVPKKDRSVRICVDYTRLNEDVQPERYQLPLSEEIFSKLAGAKYFTTLDAAAGFWQIPLHASSSDLTTFITPFGRFRFTRLPFGLSSGPEVFQRAMQHVLQKRDGVACFIDDILIWGSSKEEHDKRLRQVMERLRVCNVRLQPEKCKFRQSSITYYGHTLTQKGVAVSRDRLRAITEMKRPASKEEVRRLLGLVAYVPKFLPRHSQESAPLRQLLKDEAAWQWTPVQEDAWMKIKEMVVGAPVLAYYRQRDPTIVSCDPSSFGIGAVLLQLQSDGRRAPITYVSRALSSTEQRYSQIKKECLAMTWACEKFHCYLFGSEERFVIETDHKPLVSIMNVQSLDECPPRLMRMKLRLMRYSFEVQYVPGKCLAVADALSRAPVDDEDPRIEKVVQDHVAIVTECLPESDLQLQKMREATLRDSQLTILHRVLQTSWRTRHNLQKELQRFWPYQHLLTQVQGLIMRGTQIVIPRSLRKEMLARAHEGHQGIAKTKARLRETMWWPGMCNKVEQMMACCDVCGCYRHQQRKEPLISTPLPQLPWERVAADLFELQGDHYLLVVDYYSRFPEVRKLSSMRAVNVIQAFKGILKEFSLVMEFR